MRNLPHSHYDRDGSWRYALGATATNYTVRVLCPQCGRELDITAHSVAHNGAVSPALHCGCGFSDHVVLDGYDRGD